MNKNHKNVPRIRLAFFLFTFMVSSTALFAIDSPQFSLSYYTEVIYGESFEHVYYSDKLLSELIWDIKPILLLGLEASLEWKKGFSLNAESSFGLPAFSGLMKDSDWLNLELNLDTGKTHFSRHNAHLQYATILAIHAGWTFFPNVNNSREFSITPSLGFKYYSWKWDAQDGYIQHNSYLVNGTYPEWRESQERIPLYGVGISYLQTFYIPTIGISSSFSPVRTIQTKLGITFSPFVYSHNTDWHFIPTVERDYHDSTIWIEWHDYLSGGLFFEPEVSAIWSLSKNIQIFLNARKTNILGLRGLTSKKDPSKSNLSWTYEEDGEGGGAALDTLSLRLGCVLHLNTFFSGD